MNQEDIEYAFFAPMPPYVFKQRSNDVAKHADKLIKAYSDYAAEVESKHKQNVDSYNRKLEAFNTKKCFCGASLRYISSYNFWGCSNYKDEAKEHITFSGETPGIYGHIFIPANWIADLIKSCGLKGQVFPKQVYGFFIDQGLEDIRIKYGKTTSENSFNGFVKAKARSLIQEGEASRYLKTIYDKIAVQQCIDYKTKKGKPEFCIPDFIVSKGNDVVVVDAKLEFPDDYKMGKYISLVKFILNKKNDTRVVSGAFIMYNDDISQYIKSSYQILPLP